MASKPDLTIFGRDDTAASKTAIPSTTPAKVIRSTVPAHINNNPVSQALDVLSLGDTVIASTSSTLDVEQYPQDQHDTAPLTSHKHRLTTFRPSKTSTSRSLRQSISQDHLLTHVSAKRSSRSSLLQKPLPHQHSANMRRSSSSGSVQQPPSLYHGSPTVSRLPTGSVESFVKKRFQAELNVSHFVNEQIPRDKALNDANVVVILHDACFGHRYERATEHKGNLDNTFERPERVLASIVGVAAAYVRLGERYTRTEPKDNISAPFALPFIPFRICKTSRRMPLDSHVVGNVHKHDWITKLVQMCDSAPHKLAIGECEIVIPELASNNGQYTLSVKSEDELNAGDLYLNAGSRDAMEGAIGAVCEGIDMVFKSPSSQGARRAFVVVRPPGHHCSSESAVGFCWINNVVIGVSYAFEQHRITHAAIIDFDLHHGDGTQQIVMAHNNKRRRQRPAPTPWENTTMGYFSLHDVNSYPCEDGEISKVQAASTCFENLHNQTIWNIHMQPYKTEEEFAELYENNYKIILDKARAFLRAQTARVLNLGKQKPLAVIFISAGFDASEHENQGMQRHAINVPTGFYARFTEDVVKLSMDPDCAVEGRVISVLEGGYSNRALISGVMSHVSGLTTEAGSTVAIADDDIPRYDPEWWSTQNLEALEAVVYSPDIPEARPGNRHPVSNHYSSPTESFTAKISSNSASLRRLSHGFNEAFDAPLRPISGEIGCTSVPSPLHTESPNLAMELDVSWITATNELARLLIPADRPTASLTQKELQAAKTKLSRTKMVAHSKPTEMSPSSPTLTHDSSRRTSARVRKPKNPEPIIVKSVPLISRRRGRPPRALADDVSSSPMPEKISEFNISSPRGNKTTKSLSIKKEMSEDVSMHATLQKDPSLFPIPSLRRKLSYVQHTSNFDQRTNNALSSTTVVESERPQSATKSYPNSSDLSLSPSNSATTGDIHRKNNNGMASNSDSSSEVNGLTSQMKKFTISLGTKAQRLARAQTAKAAHGSGTNRSDEVAKTVGISKPKDRQNFPQDTSFGFTTTADVAHNITSAKLSSSLLEKKSEKVALSIPISTHFCQEIAETPAFVRSPSNPVTSVDSPLLVNELVGKDLTATETPASPIPDIVGEEKRPTSSGSAYSTMSRQTQNRVLPTFSSTSVIPFGAGKP